MHLIGTQGSHGHLSLSLDELITLSNIVNELCYGIGMPVADFQARIGASSSEVSDLLAQLLGIIDRIGANEKDDPVFDWLFFANDLPPFLLDKLNRGDGFNIPETVNYRQLKGI